VSLGDGDHVMSSHCKNGRLVVAPRALVLRAKQRHASHDPVVGVLVRAQLDAEHVGEVGPARLGVARAVVVLVVVLGLLAELLSGDGGHVHDGQVGVELLGHRLLQHLGLLRTLGAPRAALEHQAVYVPKMGEREGARERETERERDRERERERERARERERERERVSREPIRSVIRRAKKKNEQTKTVTKEEQR
jgi:hypothetical protein